MKDLIYYDGYARQYDMTIIKHYDSYFNYLNEKYSDKAFSDRINNARVKLVTKYANGEKVIDYGCGNGAFILKRKNTYGYDVDKDSVKWLKSKDLYQPKAHRFHHVCMWDVLEHLKDPAKVLEKMTGFLYVSIPIFQSLDDIKKSKHYRPGEHFWYFTHEGFVKYMANLGYSVIEHNQIEEEIGRESIHTYVFEKPSYHSLIEQYKQIHATSHYGSSATDYLDIVTPEILRLQPASILDYGCGRSDLVAHYYLDGERKIEKYDPAIPEYKKMPRGQFDLVLCMDVLEHIAENEIGRVFDEIIRKSSFVIFGISCIPARKTLPNGKNAHVTIKPIEWWENEIKQRFGACHIIWRHEEDKTFICRTYE